MAAKVTVSINVTWRSGGDSIAATSSTTVDQVGNAAIGNVQTVSGTTVAVDLGEVAGEKYLNFKNLAASGSTAVLYCDTVTPVVPGSSTAIKLAVGKTSFQVSLNDTWYAIAVGGPVDLGVVAIEV